MNSHRFFVVLLTLAAISYGQVTSTAPLSGTVVDPTGALVPGAEVTVRNASTGSTFKVATSENGTFRVPSLPTGDYAVTVVKPGFKQAQAQDVKIDVGVPTDIRITLEVGSQAETVSVEGVGAILQTQSSTVSTTLTGRQIVDLPLVSRDGLDLVLFLPGVNTPGRPRSSYVDGMGQNAINITLDGINVQDNLNKSGDGYFTYIRPRLDAVGEVTVSTSAGGADSAGEGAVQIKFVTRSGSNDLKGSVYYYMRNTALNGNYWFNNRDLAPDPRTGKAPKTPANLHQYGFRVGGPIWFPKLFNGKNRAFFFFNYEEFRLPEATLRTRTILSEQARQGIFLYTVGTTTRSVNLMNLAAANGQTSTMDPTVSKLLSDIRATTSKAGQVSALSDPNLERFAFINNGGQTRKFPTIRLDFNLSSKHSLETSFNYQDFAGLVDFLNNTDPAFPGFPNQGSQGSNRKSGVVALRSTLSARMVNEARFGMTGGTTLFFPEVNSGQFVNQGGFNLGIGAAAAGITSATVTTGPSRRHTPNTQFSDNLSLGHGSHNITLGGSFTQIRSWQEGQTVVPSITLGLDTTNDPAAAMFTTANFQDASNTNLANARSLYAVLTGRVTAINANAILNEKTGKYTYLGKDVDRYRQRQMGYFAQDSWRVTPHLTLNFGLRWEVQFPYVVQNNRYAKTTYEGLWGESGVGNLFKPGTLTGKPTEFVAVLPGERLYKTQWGSLAPSAGIAWTPNTDIPVLRTIFARGKGVFRAGYSLAYLREGAATGDDLGANPGGTITANRNVSLANLVLPGEKWPLLFRETGRLGAPPFDDTPHYPFSGVITNSATAYDPNLKLPYVHSWNIAIQRELTREMAIEVRYFGNYSARNVTTRGLNELNIVENGILDEFKLAQGNLRANLAAGRGATFRYFGAGTNTSPLPISQAYFSGLPASQAGNAALYTSTNYTNTTFVNPLGLQNPGPGTWGGAFDDDATRRDNAIKAGLPINFLVVNPGKLGGANLVTNYGYANYNAASVDVRRRFSGGLLLNANYTFGKGFEDIGRGWRVPQERAVATLGIIQVFKLNWIYELPFGKGRHLFGNAGGVLDRIVGGWAIHGTGRVQSGQPLSLGDIRIVGMTRQELQSAIGIRTDGQFVYWLPQDIIDNTRRANNFSPTTADGYSASVGTPTGRYLAPGNSASCVAVVTGQCGGTQHVVYGPHFTRFDISAVKTVKIRERLNIEMRGEFLNAFNNINFYVGSVTASESSVGGFGGTGFGQVGAAYRDTSTTNDPGGRLVQLVMRINF